METIEKLYTAKATATGGRDGKVKTEDGVIDLQLTLPKALGGSEKPGTTNPEQLFAAAYSSCFAGALGLVARNNKKSVEGATVSAHVGIGKDSTSFGLSVEMHVNIPGIDQKTGEELVNQAHQVCPYSKATRGNIDVDLIVTTK